MQREWRKIEGFEDCYEVSNDGLVRSIDRYVRSKGGSVQLRNGVMLKQTESNAGYLRVCLRNGGSEKNASVHRLVAAAFVPNEHGKEQVNHKDGDKHNNNASNLEWASPKENISHAIRLGLIEKKDMRKICEGNKKGVVVDGKYTFESVKEAAAFIGCEPTAVSSVLRGRYKTTHGHTVAYSEKRNRNA